jgi:predicted nucleic acid-binding Zn ribbon protein
MAKRDSNDQALGDVIKELLQQYNLEGKLKQARIIEAWPEVTGEMIPRHTRDLYIKGRTLFVKLDSPALKNELSYSKSKIILELNKKVGAEVVKDLVFN